VPIYSDYELERAFERDNAPAQPYFEDLWPSETKGDGLVVANNVRDGSAQGKGSLVSKAHCRLCGFPNDLSRVDHSGGSLDGNGAGGAITTATASSYPTGGDTHTEAYGDQAYRNASGCALCFSKNSSPVRVQLTDGDAWGNKPRNLGF
jgi:hypothetical protein